MKELKKQIEAILFSIGRYISVEEIAVLCKKDPQKIKEALLELTVDYENDENTSLVVLNDNEMWKLTTREEYGNVVRKVVSETELTKSQMETLAIIAFKYPIKQADLIRVRTNKAYDHLLELEKAGFISRQKYGRTRLIKLTDKFFDYFDLPRDKLRERFKGFEQLASTIEKKEEEIDDIKEQQRKESEESKEHEERERKVMDGEIDLIDDEGKEHKLEVVDEPEEKPKVEKVEEKMGTLEVVDEKEEEKMEEGTDIKEVLGIKEEEQKKEIKSVDEALGIGKEDKESQPLERESEIDDQKDDEKEYEETEEGVDLLEAEQNKEESKKEK